MTAPASSPAEELNPFEIAKQQFDLVEAKKPEESRGPWDLYRILATVPADQAFRPMAEGGCPLVRQ